jgi:hypothetical protein
MASMQDALNAAQRCTAGAGESEIEDRKRAWAEIVKASAKPEPALVEELSAALRVDKITVRRWIAGSNTPRSAMFDLIRKHFDLHEADGFSYTKHTSTTVPFDSCCAAIWTLQQWIDSLNLANAAFICKGRMKLLAADDSDLRDRLEHVLNQSASLRLYYVLTKGSPAEVAYDLMIEKMRDNNPGALKGMRKILLPESERMGLGNSFASPFVVKYRKNERKNTGRRINILYEVPVDVTGPSGKFTGTGRIAYVQLPEWCIDDVWPIWSGVLLNQGKIYDSDGTPIVISPEERELHFGDL